MIFSFFEKRSKFASASNHSIFSFSGVGSSGMTGVGGFGSGSSDSTVFVEQLLNDRRKKNNKMLGMYFILYCFYFPTSG